jgi:stage II sporulation protein D
LIFQAPQERFYRTKSNSALIAPWDPNGFVTVDGKSYRGALEVTMRDNSLVVVNIVNVEDYLRGVVPNEIGYLDTSMFEALKAQAVAARTYAYKHFLSRSSQGFDVYADVRDQVYDGKSGESALANQAIEASAGVVMQWNKQLVEAYYHSTCAGQTESVTTWNRKSVPYLQPQTDTDSQGRSWCMLSSYSNWEVHYTWPQLTSLSKRYLTTTNATPLLIFNRIHCVTILNNNPGKRVDEVRFDTDNGSFVVQGDRNRWLFRMPDTPEKTLPSAWFKVEQNANGLTLKGRGFGHGIGLCQFGARGMAKAGIGYKEILWHYYPAVNLVKW